MGPWQDQGTVIQTGTTAPEGKSKRSVWDWWRDNGDTAVDAANDIFCLISPRSPRCQPVYPAGYDPRYFQPRQDNTLLYVLIGVVIFLMLLMILKK